MAKKHVFWVKGSYEKRSLEEQGDLSLKVMGKKFGSCSSKYDVLYFPVLRPPFISTSPMINFQSIFQPPSRPPPFKFGIIKYSFEEAKNSEIDHLSPNAIFSFCDCRWIYLYEHELIMLRHHLPQRFHQSRYSENMATQYMSWCFKYRSSKDILKEGFFVW